MKTLNLLRTLLVVLGIFFSTLLVFAQDVDLGLTQLSEAQTETYQEILRKPFDPNDAVKNKIALHIEKDNAAHLLGELKAREQNLFEWSKIDAEGKTNLRTFYSMVGRYDESIKLAQELLKDPDRRMQFLPSQIRNLAYMARDLIEINELGRAADTLKTAELKASGLKTLKGGRDAPAWVLRAETDLALYKSMYLMRLGKWDESLAQMRLAVDKSKDVLPMLDLFDNEKQRVHAKNVAVYVSGAAVKQQLQMGKLIAAESNLRDTFKLAKTHGYNENHMFSFDLLSAELLNGRGQFKSSLEYVARAQKIYLQQGYSKSTIRWMKTKAVELTALAGLNQWEEALSVMLEAQEIGRTGQAGTDKVIDEKLVGWVYIQNNRLDEAINVLSNSLKSDEANFGSKHYYTAISHGLLGMAYFNQGDKVKARFALEKARAHLQSPDSLTGDFEENVIQQKISRLIFERYMKLLSLTANSNPSDAETLFLLSDRVNSSVVQQALTEAAVRSGVNTPGLSDLIRSDQDAKNEMATLVAYIENKNDENQSRQSPQVIDQFRRRFLELELHRKGYRVAIQKEYPDYFHLIQPQPPNIKDISKFLMEDEVFVSIVPTDNETYVWAINRQGDVKFHRSDWGEKKTNATVETLRKSLDVADMGARIPKFDHKSAYAIYQSFFEPVDDLIQGKSHLIVASAGALAKLPFAVLQTQAFDGSSPIDAPWFIKKISVSHVPTASGWVSLKRYKKVPHAPEALIAWGDPLFDGFAVKKLAAVSRDAKDASLEPGLTISLVRSFADNKTRNANTLELSPEDAYINYSKIPALPETRDEIQTLSKILQAEDKADLFFGERATRASVLNSSASGQMQKKQVVVFATHGLLAGDLPNLTQPALALAATANLTDSPLLTLEDILSLKLNADWVVLSACNTAGADGRAEEAMSGLARGFFFAGSRSLLVTHWSVESLSAMKLTTGVFDVYKKTPSIRRSEALRQSILSLMRQAEYSHPAYWAPYVLVGDGGR